MWIMRLQSAFQQVFSVIFSFRNLDTYHTAKELLFISPEGCSIKRVFVLDLVKVFVLDLNILDKINEDFI